MTNLLYVQLENDVALIDSRVYCRDIIEVDHGDWLQNVVNKHKSSVEQRFGQLRFENGYVNIPNGGRKETNFLMLTEAQSNAFLVLSKNTAKARDKKLDLVADFETAKQQIKASLERSLVAQPDDRDFLIQALNDAENEVLKLQQKLQQSSLDHLNFCYSAKFLHQVSGIVSFYQVKNAVKRDFVEGRDWIVVGDEVFLNESTFNILVTSFRSLRGTDLLQLPEVIRLETQLYFQYQELRRKNRRVGQCDGQLALNLPM